MEIGVKQDFLKRLIKGSVNPRKAVGKIKNNGPAIIRAWIINNYNKYLNFTTRSQRKKAKSIPIIINNFNQLSDLKKMIEDLQLRGYCNIYILDNNSSYQPLLDYYNSTNIPVIRLPNNQGHMALWKEKEIFRLFKDGYYVLTDPDVLINENCPTDFLEHFIKILESHDLITKVGFALRIDDIPDHYPLKTKVLNWETRYWLYPIVNNQYLAKIDTTFALYRPYANIENNFLSGIRVAGDLMAKHQGWYKDPHNPTEEEVNYTDTANNSSTWVLDGTTQGRQVQN